MKKKNFISRTFLSFAWWYKITCDYGESTRRPIYWLMALLGCAFLFFFYEDISHVQSQFYQEGSKLYNGTITSQMALSSLNNASKRSLSTLSPFFDLQKNELSDYTVRLLTLPLLGTLFIALRRNLERRFRH